MKSKQFKKKETKVYYFRGAKLNRSQAEQTSCAILFGIIGIIVAIAIFGTDNRLYSLITIGGFTVCGFLGYKYLSKRNKET